MMKKNLINPLKALALFLVVGGLVLVTSCGDDDDEVDEPDPTQTIKEIIEGNPDYSDFIEFYNLNASVLPDISAAGSITLFVPNNAAFDSLRSSLDTEDLTSVSPEIIATVLEFHFVPNEVRESEFGTGLTTEQGETITWNSDNTIMQGCSNTMVEVVEEKRDQRATNGVVHEVGRILIPPTICTEIGLRLGTVAQPILLGSVFSDLRQIINVADGTVPSGESSIKQILSDQTSGDQYTIFVPTNDVLTGVAAAVGVTKEQLIGSVTTSAAVARGFLLNHVYVSDAPLTAAAVIASIDPQTGVGATITMESGKQMTVIGAPASENTPTGCTNGGDTCIFLAADPQDQSTYVPIFATDVFSYDPLETASNGTVHVSSIIQ